METAHQADSIQDIYHELNQLPEPESTDTESDLFALIEATFGIPTSRIQRVASGLTSEIEGFSVLMRDGVQLVFINEVDADTANDALAPNSIVYEGRKFVAFLDRPEIGGGVFLGDIPDMVVGTLIAGSFRAVTDRMVELIEQYSA